MMASPFELAHDDGNPLDMVEDFARGKGWKTTRHDTELMTVLVKSAKGEYEVCMEWQDEFSAVLFACSIPLEIKDENYEMAAHALEQINENMWMGHFDLSNKGLYPTYRYTLLCRMIPATIAVEIVADVFDIAIAECDRFYSTFQLAQAGDVRLQDNLSAAVFDTVGEA
jgi:hypothetical protein